MRSSGAPGPVVLDVQALQSVDHRDRGIGRWTREFVRALCDQRPDLVGAITWNPRLPGPEGLEGLARTGRLCRPGSLPPGCRIYHVLSPFELGETVEGIWPAAVRESPMRLVVTLYDLIPLVFQGRYLADPGKRRRYRARLELLRAADGVLAISAATRAEAIARLGLPGSQVVDIGTGIGSEFVAPATPASAEQAREQALAALPGLGDDFILSVGGEDERKNVEGLLRAYALLPDALRARHQLVIVFKMTDGYRRHLRAVAQGLGIGGRVLLAGYVDDATLISLYQCTRLFVFPSLYEGFGLPVAEAMACGAPAVSSSTSALAEIADPAGSFDPGDPVSIAETIRLALVDARVRASLQAASQRPPPTWSGVVGKAAAVYESLL
jgi:glycosyltransferase involved in cell wall biosynthesis